MDPVRHPLDWRADGGDEEVVRNTGWNLPMARRGVRKAISAHGWRPIGHARYAELRRAIMAGRVLDIEQR